VTTTTAGLRSPPAAHDALRWLQRPIARRAAYAVGALALAILTFFPRHYLARAQMLPQDESSAGLSSILGAVGGGLQNFATLIGTHQTIEVYLVVARSNDVLTDVIKDQGLLGRPGYETLDQARLTLKEKVDIHSLTGGVLELEVKDSDPVFAQRLATAFTKAIEARVSDLSRAQTAKKQLVVEARFREVSDQLARSQAAMDAFRKANNLAAPQAQLGAAVGIGASLQAELQAAMVELHSAEQFATGENLQVKTIQARIAALQSQIAQGDQGSGAGGSAEGLATKSQAYQNLQRDEAFQQQLYNIYLSTLEQVSVENLTAEANTNVQVLAAPYIVPERQYNILPLGALLALGLLAAYTEWYVPLTGLGRRRRAPAPPAH
jgi:hypothetical protein